MERAKNQTDRPVEEDELNEERGNPLIGSLGRTGREFFNLLVDRDAHDVPLNFREPQGDSLLARLQRWTFEVFSEQPEERKALSEGDESITINSCHGPMREAEVLRDYLLRRFAEDDTFRPRDVVVMMPDPEGYAPYLRATFGGMEEGMPDYFPFSIVDREPRQESQIVDCFFDLAGVFRWAGDQPGGSGLARLLGFPDSVRAGRRGLWRLSGDGFESAMPIGDWTAIIGRISDRPRPMNTLGGMPWTGWLWVFA